VREEFDTDQQRGSFETEQNSKNASHNFLVDLVREL